MKKAIVLMNMGGPNNLGEVDVFLKNMFNDKYIIGAPQPIRAMIGWIIRKIDLKKLLIIIVYLEEYHLL